MPTKKKEDLWKHDYFSPGFVTAREKRHSLSLTSSSLSSSSSLLSSSSSSSSSSFSSSSSSFASSFPRHRVDAASLGRAWERWERRANIFGLVTIPLMQKIAKYFQMLNREKRRSFLFSKCVVNQRRGLRVVREKRAKCKLTNSPSPLFFTPPLTSLSYSISSLSFPLSLSILFLRLPFFIHISFLAFHTFYLFIFSYHRLNIALDPRRISNDNLGKSHLE